MNGGEGGALSATLLVLVSLVTYAYNKVDFKYVSATESSAFDDQTGKKPQDKTEDANKKGKPSVRLPAFKQLFVPVKVDRGSDGEKKEPQPQEFQLLRPRTEPGLEGAVELRDQLIRDDDKLSRHFERLNDALVHFDARSGANEVETYQSLKSLIRELRVVGKFITHEYSVFDKQLIAYDQHLKRAPEVYSKAAKVYKAKALTLKEPENIELANHMAASCESFIVLADRRRKEVAKLRDDVGRSIPGFKESISLLSDIETFINIYPSPPKIETEKQISRIKSYGESLEQFRSVLKDFLDKIKDAAGPDPLRPPA